MPLKEAAKYGNDEHIILLINQKLKNDRKRITHHQICTKPCKKRLKKSYIKVESLEHTHTNFTGISSIRSSHVLTHPFEWLMNSWSMTGPLESSAPFRMVKGEGGPNFFDETNRKFLWESKSGPWERERERERRCSF